MVERIHLVASIINVLVGCAFLYRSTKEDDPQREQSLLLWAIALFILTK